MTTNKPPYGATCTDQQHETHVLSKHDSHAKTNQTSGCEDRPSARPVFPESSGATYADRDHMALGDYYLRHVSAMTGEALHAKSAIAAELAHRDREIDRQHAELEVLRMGYNAARLEIESLNAQLHAAKQINASQFWLLTSSIPGSALRVSHWQAPAQAAPAAVAGPVVNRTTVIEWLDANDIEVTDRQMDGLFHFAAPTTHPAPQQEAQEPVAVVVPCHTPSGKRVALYSAKQDLPIGTQLYTAHQPSPAAQGDALSDDAVRVPLDSLHADAAYLIGRLREGSMPYARVIEIIRERIDAAKAAIRARAAQGDVLDAWQPIETAPKDGEAVILTEGGKVFHGGFITIDFKEIRDSEGNFIDQIDPDEYWMNFDAGDVCTPTHWMPKRSLPMPPDTARAAQEGKSHDN